MNLPRRGRKALYVKVDVIDYDTGLPVVLSWQLSLDGGATWITGDPATIVLPDGGGTEQVTRFLLYGPDAPTDQGVAVAASVEAPLVMSVDGDEILVATLGPITVA